MKDTGDIIVIILAIVVVLFAALNAFIALQQVADLARITGYQVSNIARGNITLSIPSNVQIEFIVPLINWSNGSIIQGRDHAQLITSANFDIQVQNGTWVNGSGQGKDTGLVLRNSGNVNVTVNLTTGYNATNFFGNITGEKYEWNISFNTLSDPNNRTCGFPWKFPHFHNFTDVNKSGEIVCKNLSFTPGENELRLDIKLVIPQGVARKEYSDTLVAVAEVAI